MGLATEGQTAAKEERDVGREREKREKADVMRNKEKKNKMIVNDRWVLLIL